MEGWGAMNMRRKLNVGCGLSWAGVPNHYIVAGALLVFKDNNLQHLRYNIIMF